MTNSKKTTSKVSQKSTETSTQNKNSVSNKKTTNDNSEVVISKKNPKSFKSQQPQKLERKKREVVDKSELISLKQLYTLMGIKDEEVLPEVDLDNYSKFNSNLSNIYGFKIFSNHSDSQELAELMFGNSNQTAKSSKLVISEKLGLTKATISSFVNGKIFVSTGSKSDILLDEKQKDYMEIGTDLEVLVYKTGKDEFSASISKATKQKNWNSLISSKNTNNVFTGKILKSIPHGYIVDVLGFECFLPGANASLNRLDDVNSIVGSIIDVLVINYMEDRKSIIVDAKKLLQKSQFEIIKTWKTGTEIIGKISGSSPSHGIFVNINESISALIPIQSLNKETREKVMTKTLKNGSVIVSYMKEFDYKNRLVLTQNLEEISSWKLESFRNSMEKGSILTGKIISKLEHGYLIELSKGVKGVIPFLFSKNYNGSLDLGTILDVVIYEINFEKEKMTLVPYTN
jgi:ribosomal protein S1